MDEQGRCYLVATPIGNLEDITYRAIRILQEVDIVACEDTRNTVKLLNHYDIKAKLMSFHQHNEQMRSDYFCELIKEGKKIAIVSDAGMPGISDPGTTMVQKCIQNEIIVEVIPGPSAAISALVISGLDTSDFYFAGFLSMNKKRRKEQFEGLRFLESTIILYEAPHKIRNTLLDIKENLGEKNIAIAREMTKIHEEIFRGSISRAIDHFQQKNPRGEFVIVIEGHKKTISEELEWENISIEEHLAYYLNQNIERKETVKLIAKDRGVPKREIYEQIMKK
ncbi:16S rRNA (cytidine(1402)-2'-O)-methyltransferase [Alkalibaculum sp. M08DMB]|uniref:Ribosomal RNA small subunit methyltransferase I n=1 Tax=Alkalibaculum sporogenes TaxID=2655001 RepID=A0A6A7K7H1_9FIRM|nr:16S rRNA (cytidine(1402)-2'-O)-methyltransferase [Alkalibaculum sporogenes]MPW25291.1 16S rRNA (cytidine(1402)-2'-O)-methyltransferase [Alkalibaculum sporogenes]